VNNWFIFAGAERNGAGTSQKILTNSRESRHCTVKCYAGLRKRIFGLDVERATARSQ